MNYAERLAEKEKNRTGSKESMCKKVRKTWTRVRVRVRVRVLGSRLIIEVSNIFYGFNLLCIIRRITGYKITDITLHTLAYLFSNNLLSFIVQL